MKAIDLIQGNLILCDNNINIVTGSRGWCIYSVSAKNENNRFKSDIEFLEGITLTAKVR